MKHSHSLTTKFFIAGILSAAVGTIALPVSAQAENNNADSAAPLILTNHSSRPPFHRHETKFQDLKNLQETHAHVMHDRVKPPFTRYAIHNEKGNHAVLAKIDKTERHFKAPYKRH